MRSGVEIREQSIDSLVAPMPKEKEKEIKKINKGEERECLSVFHQQSLVRKHPSVPG
jgi:hypothetical protein